MKISEALRGVKLIAFDTSPFIYYTEDSPAYVDKMDVIFDLIYADKTQIITSIITLTEVLVKPLRIGDIVVESKYRTLFSSTGKIQLQLVDRAVAERAAVLRAIYNLKTPDALQVATALESNCEAFLTNDAGIKRVTEIRVLVLDELELDPAP